MEYILVDEGAQVFDNGSDGYLAFFSDLWDSFSFEEERECLKGRGIASCFAVL